ncbi:MAG: glucosaminidase domain-containing protein [Endozoicomonas sp. (ex Botrylloides leachii)]|nr:glucosaminidase domain-containing protein [Endozoicomonas sp. (ex Botrylloides leachii)]
MLKKIDLIMLSILVILTLPTYWLSAVNSSGSHDISTIKIKFSAATSNSAHEPETKIPDFSQITDTKRKKQAFFDFMLSMVTAQNEALLTLRKAVQTLEQDAQLTTKNKQWLAKLAKHYQVNMPEKLDALFFSRLLARVDIIPASLALAQAANESAWGTSRFAQQGNNLFGQWCFTKGCGIVPTGRPSGATYEVRKFSSPSDSVRAYMYNLNTHHQYKHFREIRAAQRAKQQPITGLILAEGLRGYSTRGIDYVNELINMIRYNNLVNYDAVKAMPKK